MNPYIEIDGRKVGIDYDPLVIAEIGINHNGDLKTALEMVDAAYEAGVEVVKHQTHIIEDEMSSEATKIIPGNSDKSIYEIMDSCALNEEDERKLMEYVQQKGMIFISTPFSRAAVDRLVKFKVKAFKIGSGECNNYPLLEYLAGYGKPVILSTGMNSIESIRKSVAIFEAKNVPHALLHTTNLYPTPDRLVRLGAMQELAEEFPNTVFGLSDHTVSNHACFGAVALGASILERHFTDHMEREGPDIVCSMDLQACKDLIEGAKILKQQRGGTKGAASEEQVTIDFAFASVCTIKPIKKGEPFTEENIWVKRPGTGEILAEEYKAVLGQTASNDIENNVLLKRSDVSNLSDD
ncbi:MAG: N-acetylneuraminate synthase family protein [Bacteroidota bacterium]